MKTDTRAFSIVVTVAAVLMTSCTKPAVVQQPKQSDTTAAEERDNLPDDSPVTISDGNSVDVYSDRPYASWTKCVNQENANCLKHPSKTTRYLAKVRVEYVTLGSNPPIRPTNSPCPASATDCWDTDVTSGPSAIQVNYTGGEKFTAHASADLDTFALQSNGRLQDTLCGSIRCLAHVSGVWVTNIVGLRDGSQPWSCGNQPSGPPHRCAVTFYLRRK
jgi:hypothetical protein